MHIHFTKTFKNDQLKPGNMPIYRQIGESHAGYKARVSKAVVTATAIQLEGAPQFSHYLSERLPGRVELGDVVEEKGDVRTVPVLVDGEEVGRYSWRDSPSLGCRNQIVWTRRYVGGVPGRRNAYHGQRHVLAAKPSEKNGLERIDRHLRIPFP